MNHTANHSTSHITRTAELIDLLRTHGYKVTPARRAVLETLGNSHEHFEPTSVLERSKQIYPTIGRATVYRTLEMLARIGVLRPIHSTQNTLTFIWAKGGHHHMVCSDCGDVVEFEECIAGAMTDKLEDMYGFKINSHLLEFYGQCQACQPNPFGEKQ